MYELYGKFAMKFYLSLYVAGFAGFYAAFKTGAVDPGVSDVSYAIRSPSRDNENVDYNNVAHQEIIP